MAHPLSALRHFLKTESIGGLLLMASAATALLVANSPLSESYTHLLHHSIGPLSLLHWVNDGLMTLFFLLVGLEIKREVLDGQLQSWPNRLLPGAAAVGGMAVPALVYVAINLSSPETLRGWAIPTATDIAFALGILSLLGPRVPVSLKVFLTALAILDDLGAVLIIALFYTGTLSLPMLGLAGLVLAALTGLNRARVKPLWPYLALGAVLWATVLMSGLHATLAGVLLALTIPLNRTPGHPESATSPLHRLEHALSPWSALLVLPVFGFANAGVLLTGLSPSQVFQPVTLGIALGLSIGKPVGILGSIWLMVKLGLAQRPAHAGWRHISGMALLCGVGFTMSLFIGLLAFPDTTLQTGTKIGVLLGSLLSALLGTFVFISSAKNRLNPDHPAPPAP